MIGDKAPKLSFNIPVIKVPVIKVTPINYTTGNKRSLFEEMSKGERAGYRDGYYGRPNLSVNEDTVDNDYWLGYSCGYNSGEFDREHGNPSTLG